MFLSPTRSFPRSVSRSRDCAPPASPVRCGVVGHSGVWALATEAPAGKVPTGHRAAVTAVRGVSWTAVPGVISDSDDHPVRVWDLATSQPVCLRTARLPFTACSDRSIASSPTGGPVQPPCRREDGGVLDEFEW